MIDKKLLIIYFDKMKNLFGYMEKNVYLCIKIRKYEKNSSIYIWSTDDNRINLWSDILIWYDISAMCISF